MDAVVCAQSEEKIAVRVRILHPATLPKANNQEKMAKRRPEGKYKIMKSVTVVYHKYQNFIERVVFPVILILYPLLRIRQGIDVADTTYSLANFQYFASMDGTWMVATFLANALGSLLMHLPYGDTLPGMYFYTALIQSLTALVVYEAFRRRDRSAGRMPMPLAFAGEFLALGLCWCPSTVLYNYMTYLFMAAGILLLYRGILKEDRRYYMHRGAVVRHGGLRTHMPAGGSRYTVVYGRICDRVRDSACGDLYPVRRRRVSRHGADYVCHDGEGDGL